MPPADRAHSRARVLILIKGLGIGGAERLISEGARFWSTDDFQYGVAYVLPWKDQLVPDLKDTGIRSVSVGSRWWVVSSPLKLRRLVRSWEPALIHAHLPVTGILARTMTRVPVIYTEHNVVESYRTTTRVVNRMTYGRNAAVVAVSDAVADSIAGYPGPDPVVIPNGVAVSATEQGRRRVLAELGIASDRPLVVHVGNIRPAKGHDTLIEAASQLADLVPGIAIVSIGGEKDPGDLERLRGAAAERGLDDTLQFIGMRENAVDFIASADVFVNPSHAEGLPLVVLEAMMAGTPVVATAAGGVPSVVHDGETGRLVDVGDAAALATAVAEVLSDAEAAKEMADRAQRVAEADYGLERMVKAYEAMYRALLDG